MRGSADYERFVRKHLNLFAPAEDGQVEAGPSHVHPELGPFGPPPVERFRDLNRELLARAADRDGGARAVADRHALPRRRAAHPAGAQPARALPRRRRVTKAGRTLHLSQRVPIAHRPRRRRRVRRARRRGERPAAAGRPALVPAGLGWAAVRLRAAKQRLPLVLPLDASARAVIDAYGSWAS